MKTIYHYLSKVLLGTSILAMFLFASSCSQETVLDPAQNGAENLNAKAAKGKKARPIKATLFNFADPNQQADDILLCIPEEAGFPLTRNIIGGNMSHLGKLQQGISDEETGERKSGSFGVPISCEIDLETFARLYTEFEVYYVAANGDQFVLGEFVTIDFPYTFVDDEGVEQIDYTSGTFTNTLDVNGDPMPGFIVSGTGRFEDAEGKIFLVNGVFGPEGSTWELIGTIAY